MGGLPHYLTLLLNKLNDEADMEVLLVLPGKRGATLGSGVEEKREGMNFRLFELPEYTAWYGKSFFRGLKRLLEQERPGILVSGWPYTMHFVLNPAMGRFLRKKNIRLINREIPFNVPPYGAAGRYLKEGKLQHEAGGEGLTDSLAARLRLRLLGEIRKRYFNRADALIFYVDTACDLMKTYGVPGEKIFITANSPDTDLLLKTYEKVRQLPSLLPPNPHRIIHVGRLVRWKRVDLIIEAAGNLCRQFPGLELVIVGYGPEEEHLRSQADALGLSAHLRFTGGVYEEETLGRYLHESAVYVLAGMGGLSINDAMCFGKPVICSEADGTEKMLVRHGENGYFFPKGDAAGLARKIASLLADPEKVKTFGRRSLDIIRHEINIHTVLEKYREAFRSVTGSTQNRHEE